MTPTFADFAFDSSPPGPATPALIAFGSNQGDRQRMLQMAVDQLVALEQLKLVAVSDPIETEPVGGSSQLPYVNAVIRVETCLSATQLVSALLTIERELGRRRDQRWGPRPIDLDLLLLGNVIINQPGVVVPHPRMSFRKFVLEPACQIAPQLLHPTSGLTMAQLLHCLNHRDNRVGILVQQRDQIPQVRGIVERLQGQAAGWQLKILESKKVFFQQKKDWKLVVWVTSDCNTTQSGESSGQSDSTWPGPSLHVTAEDLSIELAAALQAMS